MCVCICMQTMHNYSNKLTQQGRVHISLDLNSLRFQHNIIAHYDFYYSSFKYA